MYRLKIKKRKYDERRTIFEALFTTEDEVRAFLDKNSDYIYISYECYVRKLEINPEIEEFLSTLDYAIDNFKRTHDSYSEQIFL